MSQMQDKRIKRYLRELKLQLMTMSRTDRNEILADISHHIEESLADDPSQIDAVLQQLGTPEDIATEAKERFGVPASTTGLREVLALVLIAIGGVVIPILGWCAGLYLLWTSPAWTVRQKIVGTLIPPGGLIIPAYLLVFPYHYSCWTPTSDVGSTALGHTQNAGLVPVPGLEHALKQPINCPLTPFEQIIVNVLIPILLTACCVVVTVWLARKAANKQPKDTSNPTRRILSIGAGIAIALVILLALGFIPRVAEHFHYATPFRLPERVLYNGRFYKEFVPAGCNHRRDRGLKKVYRVPGFFTGEKPILLPRTFVLQHPEAVPTVIYVADGTCLYTYTYAGTP